MATTSTVPAVKAALVDLLATAVNDTEVQVVYGRPQDSLVKAEFVHVADVSYSAEIANIKAGRKQYDENYTVDVVVAVGKPRGTSEDAEARAFALFEHLRDLLADDPSLGGVDGVVWAVLESVDAATEHQGSVVASVIVATVRVRARVE